ncbi:sensor domain-containing protein, partial [Streptomyces sp. NPDC001880]
MTMSPQVPDNDRPPPARIIPDRWTWKEIGHLLANLPMVIVGFVYTVLMIAVGVALAVTVIGLPLLALGLHGARLVGKAERGRARAMLGVRIDEPSPMDLARREKGFFPWLWSSLKDPVGWRTVLYSFVRLPWGVLTFAVTLVSLLVLWPVLPRIARLLSNVDRSMVRGLLSPSDELERRIAELESDRGVVVDTAAADLRRIERDLHDGAQARL